VATVVRGHVERMHVSDPELDGALSAALAQARLVP
jgi:hypothetical protein